ncbi:MAG: hypothetical protein IPM63_04460 [Acidobacteriota bacterium]|nr:MAG: hypothetical protein IPM63_04460 [Acidobacteriota bacterium]
MKRLIVSLVVALAILGGAKNTIAECGQQHAERCLTSGINVGKESPDLKTSAKLRIVFVILSRMRFPL